MEEYKIKIGIDERGISGTLLNYQYRYGKNHVLNKIKSNDDAEIVEICRGLVTLLDSKEVKVTIKSK
ncbi:MAG: hypothetical protein AABX30_03185 [Nanoarchaeota archaeon]